MLLRLPQGLHYPITVTDLLKQPNDNVERFAPLFSYSYQTTVTEGDGLGEDHQVLRTFPAKYESNIDGKLKAWKIKKSTVIEQRQVKTSCRIAKTSLRLMVCKALR